MKKFAFIALALAAFVALATMGQTLAATEKDGYVILYEDTTNYSGFRAYVETPDSVSLDQESWEFTVYIYPETTGTGTNQTFTVEYTISDGTVNITKTSTIAAKNDKTVYGNITFDPNVFSENKTAWVKVQLLNSTNVVLDSWTGHMSIYKTALSGSGDMLTSTIITLIPLFIIVPMLAKVTKKFGGGRD